MLVSPTISEHRRRERWYTFRPGDLVVSREGYPTRYEVVDIQADGLLRVRGLNWAPGYTALVEATSVRPTTAILSAEGSGRRTPAAATAPYWEKGNRH